MSSTIFDLGLWKFILESLIKKLYNITLNWRKTMNEFIVDVESDGPCPGIYSMLAFGCVNCATGNTFYGRMHAVTDNFLPGSVPESGLDRNAGKYPGEVMKDFGKWLGSGRKIFISDNPAFDWQFINYYFWKYTGRNPFGHSARRIGDFAAGLANDWQQQSKWKQLRDTKHTHHPVDDALGNWEAWRKLIAKN